MPHGLDGEHIWHPATARFWFGLGCLDVRFALTTQKGRRHIPGTSQVAFGAHKKARRLSPLLRSNDDVLGYPTLPLYPALRVLSSTMAFASTRREQHRPSMEKEGKARSPYRALTLPFRDLTKRQEEAKL
jgi:hypothetical protein